MGEGNICSTTLLYRSETVKGQIQGGGFFGSGSPHLFGGPPKFIKRERKLGLILYPHLFSQSIKMGHGSGTACSMLDDYKGLL